MKTNRNNSKNTADLTLEIARTQLELEFTQNHLVKTSREMVHDVINETFNVYTIAQIAFSLFKKIGSSVRMQFRKRQEKQEKHHKK